MCGEREHSGVCMCDRGTLPLRKGCHSSIKPAYVFGWVSNCLYIHIYRCIYTFVCVLSLMFCDYVAARQVFMAFKCVWADRLPLRPLSLGSHRERNRGSIEAIRGQCFARSKVSLSLGFPCQMILFGQA